MRPEDYLKKEFVDTISEFRGVATEITYFTDFTSQIKLEAVTSEEGSRRIEWFLTDRVMSAKIYDNQSSDVGFRSDKHE